MKITILGLTITSSWGNGHATTFRGLVRELNELGHDVTFLERDVPWYGDNCDMPHPPYCRTFLYSSLDELKKKFTDCVVEADMVIVGSYVPEGVEVGRWVIENAEGVTAFYDIDTPVTLAKMERKDNEYIKPSLIPKYHMYLSFTGGPLLEMLEDKMGSPMTRQLACSVDTDMYYPEEHPVQWDLGYLGTYSNDRQPPLEKLMLEAARQWQRGKFVVAGPQYPQDIKWPRNVQRIRHLAPADHRKFYNGQRFTQNITRADMIKWGYSPSVRLFEAAACGTPIISDNWEGLDSFLKIGKEILVSRSAKDTLHYLCDLPEEERLAIGRRARKTVMQNHTARHRAMELISYYKEACGAEVEASSELDFEAIAAEE